jgi:hypothetical protein
MLYSSATSNPKLKSPSNEKVSELEGIPENCKLTFAKRITPPNCCTATVPAIFDSSGSICEVDKLNSNAINYLTHLRDLLHPFRCLPNFPITSMPISSLQPLKFKYTETN